MTEKLNIVDRDERAQAAFGHVLDAKAAAENAWSHLHPDRPAYDVTETRAKLRAAIAAAEAALRELEGAG